MIRLVTVILAVVVSAGLTAIADEKADRPNYTDGDCWVFSSVKKNYMGQVSGEAAMPADGEHKLCFLEEKFYLVSASERMPITLASPWGSIVPVEKSRTLKFPLAVGRTTKENYRAHVRGTNRYQNIVSEVRVVGMEDVKTPVGFYKTFKIERDNMLTSGLGARHVYFFSPETKSMIKYHYEALLGSSATWDVELIEYQPAESIGGRRP